MTRFTDMLAVGDLRSDGLANEVTDIVSGSPDLLPDLVDALRSSNGSVRGHAADALEKVTRSDPASVEPFLPVLLRRARRDEVPMVRWHLAMLLGHLAALPATIPSTRPALLSLLSDSSPFVRSWAITSLTIIARRSPRSSPAIVRALAPLTRDASPAVAKRAQLALRVLTDQRLPVPRSWIKSPHLHDH
jgi:HEAT repeat protein